LLYNKIKKELEQQLQTNVSKISAEITAVK